MRIGWNWLKYCIEFNYIAVLAIIVASKSAMASKMDMIGKKAWCVVGSHGKNPICDRLMEHLAANGKIAHAINPRSTEQGIESIASLNPVPEVINLVVNPQIGPKVLDAIVQGKDKGVGQALWVQPGAAWDSIAEDCKKVGVELYQGCVLVDM